MSCLQHLSACAQSSQSQMTEQKEGTSSVPEPPAQRGCLMRCPSLNDGSYSAYKQGKKLVALLRADRAPHGEKGKICSLVASVGGKKETTHPSLLLAPLPTSDHCSHLFLSEYQALWPNSLLGAMPGRHPILIAGSTQDMGTQPRNPTDAQQSQG